MFNCRQKINFILHVFLEILERYCKIIILGTLGIPGYAHSKWYYQFVKNFHVYLQVENQPHHQYFSGNIAKICKLLILGTNDQFVTSIFIYMPKINFIHIYLDILHFKESCNLIGRKHLGPYLKNQNFSRYETRGEISITISFRFRLFPVKTCDKISQKMQKILFWGHFEPFLPKFGQKWIFLAKRALSVFNYSNYLPSSCKN